MSNSEATAISIQPTLGGPGLDVLAPIIATAISIQPTLGGPGLDVLAPII
jgi:hypothetical protein